MSKKETSTEVAQFEGQVSIAERATDVGKGTSRVTADNMAIPRLKLLQVINKETQPSKAEYIEGAMAGQILNTVTSELHSAMFVVPLDWKEEFVIWQKPHGSGKVASFDSEKEALDYMEANDLDMKGHSISRNPMHYVAILAPTGEVDGVAILDMPNTKIKVSKNWNTQINKQEQRGMPAFGCVWELSVIEETATNGDYYNYKIGYVADVPDSMYAELRKQYEAFEETVAAPAAGEEADATEAAA